MGESASLRLQRLTMLSADGWTLIFVGSVGFAENADRRGQEYRCGTYVLFL